MTTINTESLPTAMVTFEALRVLQEAGASHLKDHIHFVLQGGAKVDLVLLSELLADQVTADKVRLVDSFEQGAAPEVKARPEVVYQPAVPFRAAVPWQAAIVLGDVLVPEIVAVAASAGVEAVAGVAAQLALAADVRAAIPAVVERVAVPERDPAPEVFPQPPAAARVKRGALDGVSDVELLRLLKSIVRATKAAAARPSYPQYQQSSNPADDAGKTAGSTGRYGRPQIDESDVRRLMSAAKSSGCPVGVSDRVAPGLPVMLAAAKSLSYQAIMKDAPAEDIHTSYPFAISLKEVTSLDKKVVFNSTTDGKVGLARAWTMKVHAVYAVAYHLGLLQWVDIEKFVSAVQLACEEAPDEATLSALLSELERELEEQSLAVSLREAFANVMPSVEANSRAQRMALVMVAAMAKPPASPAAPSAVVTPGAPGPTAIVVTPSERTKKRAADRKAARAARALALRVVDPAVAARVAAARTRPPGGPAVAAAAASPVPAAAAGATPPPAQQECWDFKNGRCQRGQNCRFSH